MAIIQHRVVIFLATMVLSVGAVRPLQAVDWHHPGGIVTENTLAEVKAKVGTYEWARTVYNDRGATLKYNTVGGSDRYRPAPPVNIAIEGDLWQITRQQHRFAGKIK